MLEGRAFLCQDGWPKSSLIILVFDNLAELYIENDSAYIIYNIESLVKAKCRCLSISE